ncbi:sigma-70 family RNA polymerase sigma factor [Xanthomonadaceae bacterium JHOS43]|nr:sigma-70 family RNA polymerase sigma factor [Xanthomonadaceae bacterium JHOS43]MCX7563342.1 sigma-70 family RNA polymerase sigma factor [Xanthomonadaceae bacterium XH05]
MSSSEALVLLIDQHLPAAQAGDEAAFGKIISGCQNGITAIALAITRDVPASEDIAQEAFFSAWRHLPRLRNPSSFLPWLRQITRNLSHDHLRRKRNERRYDGELEDILAVVADPAPDHSERLTRQHEEAVVADLIDELPEETREILLIYYREGQSSKQVASLLGMQDAAVRKRLSRARMSLREDMLKRLGEFAQATAPTLAFTAIVVAGLSVSPSAAAAGVSAASASLASQLAGKSGPAASLAGRLIGRGALGNSIAGGGAGKLLIGAAGGMVFALIAGVAAVFFGVRRHWITSTDHQERRELAWFAAAGLVVVLVFTTLMGAAVLTQSTLLPALSLVGMMGTLGGMNLAWLPRILARRHEREARRDPVTASHNRRAERRMAWAGMLIGMLMGASGLLFGWMSNGPL